MRCEQSQKAVLKTTARCKTSSQNLESLSFCGYQGQQQKPKRVLLQEARSHLNAHTHQQSRSRWPLALMVITICVICSLKYCKEPDADLHHSKSLPKTSKNSTDLPEKRLDQILNAIYLAEGGKKAKKPFGILAVNCSGENHCREIAKRTVLNSYQRWLKTNRKQTFLQHLQKTYAPIGAKNDPKGLNKNWLGNVSYFLGR
jgi:hypothetical protein